MVVLVMLCNFYRWGTDDSSWFRCTQAQAQAFVVTYYLSVVVFGWTVLNFWLRSWIIANFAPKAGEALRTEWKDQEKEKNGKKDSDAEEEENVDEAPYLSWYCCYKMLLVPKDAVHASIEASIVIELVDELWEEAGDDGPDIVVTVSTEEEIEHTKNRQKVVFNIKPEKAKKNTFSDLRALKKQRDDVDNQEVPITSVNEKNDSDHSENEPLTTHKRPKEDQNEGNSALSRNMQSILIADAKTPEEGLQKPEKERKKHRSDREGKESKSHRKHSKKDKEGKSEREGRHKSKSRKKKREEHAE
jgi:hypothetical protein